MLKHSSKLSMARPSGAPNHGEANHGGGGRLIPGSVSLPKVAVLSSICPYVGPFGWVLSFCREIGLCCGLFAQSRHQIVAASFLDNYELSDSQAWVCSRLRRYSLCSDNASMLVPCSMYMYTLHVFRSRPRLPRHHS
jgi:hypothetical protein